MPYSQVLHSHAMPVILLRAHPHAGTAAVERLTAAWRAAPAVAPLSDQVVAGIIARARVAAAAAFPEHSRALPGAPAAHAEVGRWLL